MSLIKMEDAINIVVVVVTIIVNIIINHILPVFYILLAIVLISSVGVT